MFPIALSRLPRWVSKAGFLAVAWCLTAPLLMAAGGPTKLFDIPEGEAIETLKRAAHQAGLEIMYSAEVVRGVRTQPVRGEFNVHEALHRMVANTVLRIVRDEKTGALAVARVVPPKPEASPSTPTEASPSSPKTMKRKNPLALLFGWLAVTLSPGHALQAANVETLAQTPAGLGTLSGVVTNAATGLALEGATVRLEGTSHATVTERDGSFRLRVPPGRYALTADYSGLDGASAPVVLAAGDALTQSFALTSSIYRLAEFVVATEREGSALAITLQRQAPNVKSVVASDAFGSLQGNPGDVLQRLPGVTGLDEGGEIRFVQIRGMDAQLSTITVDGNRMANAGSAGTNRDFQMQTIVVEGIERMEVIKSPTPDMDGDSIGGAVNMVSTSPFGRPAGRHLTLSYGLTDRPTDSRDSPRQHYSISYSEVFGKKLGVSLNYGKRQQLSAIDYTQQAHERVVKQPLYTWSLLVRDITNVRTRWGGNLKLDYKLSDQSRFFVNSSMNKHYELQNLNQVTFAARMEVAAVAASGSFTGRGAILPGYTNNLTTWRGQTTNPGDNTATLLSDSLNKDAGTWHHQIGGVHEFTHTKIDYDAYYSDSIVEYNNMGGFTLRADGVGMRIERDPEQAFWPKYTQFDGPDIFNIASYNFNQLNNRDRRAVDNYWGSQFNLKREFRTVIPAYLKAGLRVREQSRDRYDRSTRWTYIGPNLAQFVNPLYDYDLQGRSPSHGNLPHATIPFRDDKGDTRDYTGFNIGTALRQSPQLFREDIVFNTTQRETNKLAFTEKISAAYLMGNVELGKLGILGGLRVEETETWGKGTVQVVTPAEQARRNAWVGPVTDAEARRRVEASFAEPFESSGKYKKVFPGLHFKYEPLRGLLLRGSYATNIGRPNIGTLVPNVNASYETQSVTVNNPGLKPQYADNFDVFVEYYFEPVGMFSAGVFLKEIKDFIITDTSQIVGAGADNGFDGEYQGFRIQTQTNGGRARVRGLELAYQQQFTFLPGLWNGFGAYANYTRLQTKGDYGAATVRSTNEVAGFTPETANVGISYIRGGHSIRLQLNYIGRTLSSYSTNQALLQYKLAKPQLDVKTTFRLNKRLDAYVDIWNLFSNPTELTEYYGGHPGTMSKINYMAHAGLRLRL